MSRVTLSSHPTAGRTCTPLTKHRHHGLPWIKVWNWWFSVLQSQSWLHPSIPMSFSDVEESPFPGSQVQNHLCYQLTAEKKNHRIKPTHRKVRITSKRTRTMCVWREGACPAQVHLWPLGGHKHWWERLCLCPHRGLSFSALKLSPPSSVNFVFHQIRRREATSQGGWVWGSQHGDRCAVMIIHDRNAAVLIILLFLYHLTYV